MCNYRLLELRNIKMVFKICFVCGGVKKCFYYCIVVVDSCMLCDGCFIEKIGIYNLMFLKDGECVMFDMEKVKFWIVKGVKLFDCVGCFINQIDVDVWVWEVGNNLNKGKLGVKVQECFVEKVEKEVECKVVEEEVKVVVVEVEVVVVEVLAEEVLAEEVLVEEVFE